MDYQSVAISLTKQYPNVYIAGVVMCGATIDVVSVKDGIVTPLTNSKLLAERLS